MKNYLGTQGSQRLRGQTALIMLIGLLVSIGSNQAAAGPGETPEAELAYLKLKLSSMQQRYSRLCEDNNRQNCSGTVVNCTDRGCPKEWLHVGDKCYYFSDDKMNWQNSSESCTAMGSHLTILHSKEQHVALEKEARRIRRFDHYYWIGLSDIEKEGDWRWVDNTTLQNEGFWNKWSLMEGDSEPNNNLSGGPDGEDCGVLDSYTQTWSDVPCLFIYHRICEIDAIQLL